MLNLGWSRSGAPELWKVLDEATRVAETKLKDPKAWWEDMGHAAQVLPQAARFRGLIAADPRRRNGRICEIGFNAGHSAIMWLHGTSASWAKRWSWKLWTGLQVSIGSGQSDPFVASSWPETPCTEQEG